MKVKKAEIKDMLGKVMVSVEKSLNDKRGRPDDSLLFKTADGKHYRLFHDQDCCEEVYIESITGDLSDLIGTPLLMAEESTSDKNPSDVTMKPRDEDDTFTWTFYKFATRKGYVDVRWYGESNGYYSESVNFEEIKSIEEIA